MRFGESYYLLLNERIEDVRFDVSNVSPPPPKLTRLDLSDNSNGVITDNTMSIDASKTYGAIDTTVTSISKNHYNSYRTSNNIVLAYLNLLKQNPSQTQQWRT